MPAGCHSMRLHNAKARRTGKFPGPGRVIAVPTVAPVNTAAKALNTKGQYRPKTIPNKQRYSKAVRRLHKAMAKLAKED